MTDVNVIDKDTLMEADRVLNGEIKSIDDAQARFDQTVDSKALLKLFRKRAVQTLMIDVEPTVALMTGMAYGFMLAQQVFTPGADA